VRVSSISIGIGLGLLTGCAPELTANGAPRCEESLECATDSVCYRGFCVLDDGTARDGGDIEVADASLPAAPPEHDAGITPAIEVSDASSAATDMSQQPEAAAPQVGPSAPATAPKQPAPMQPAPMQPTSTQPTPDAGPIVVDLPGNCTLAECCQEARASLAGTLDAEPSAGPGGGPGGAKDEGKDEGKPEPRAKRVKACGCADPGLLSGVLCGLLGPLGVEP
jgi:hypothetical protein